MEGLKRQRSDDLSAFGRVLVTCHHNADADALGSLAAASLLFPGATLLWPGTFDPVLNELLQSRGGEWLPQLRTARQMEADAVFDTVVVVDTCSAARVAHAAVYLKTCSRVLCFDHHPTPSDALPCLAYWHAAWGSATSLLLAVFVCHVDVLQPIAADQLGQLLRTVSVAALRSVPSNAATLMLLGIHCDTGSFQFPSTTPWDLLAAHLLMLGCEPQLTLVHNFLLHSLPSTLNLSKQQQSALDQMLASLETHMNVAVGTASGDEDCRNFSQVVQIVLEQRGCQALFGVAQFGTSGVTIVGRSTQSSGVDCGAICRMLGGGGHARAASATLSPMEFTVVSARERLYAALGTALGDVVTLETIMSPQIVVIPFGASVASASKLMMERNLKKAPCLDSNGRVSGLIDRSVMEKAVKFSLGDHEAADFAQAAPSWLRPSASLDAAVDVLLRQNGRLILIQDSDDGPLLGVVSRSDVIAHLMKNPFLQQTMEIEQPSSASRTLKLDSDPNGKFLASAGALADELGVQLFVVGGFPRDVILKRPNDDIDFVVAGGEAIAFARALHAAHGDARVPVLEHEQFHTAVVTLANGLKIDVATARLEYYPLPAALPVVEISSLKMDLGRRDFTINALAVQLNAKRFGVVVDFFRSCADIDARTVSVLHALSFVEDPTRVFRACRFASRFNFQISAATERLLRRAVDAEFVTRLTGSRIFNELEKISLEENPVTPMEALHRYRVFSCFSRELQDKFSADELRESFGVASWFRETFPKEPVVRWKVMILSSAWKISHDSFAGLVTRLILPTKSGEFEAVFASSHDALKTLRTWLKADDPELQRPSIMVAALRKLPLEAILVVLGCIRLHLPDAWSRVAEYLLHHRFVTLSITGNDLKAFGLKPGPTFKRILDAALELVLDGKLSREKADQLKWASENAESFK